MVRLNVKSNSVSEKKAVLCSRQNNQGTNPTIGVFKRRFTRGFLKKTRWHMPIGLEP